MDWQTWLKMVGDVALSEIHSLKINVKREDELMSHLWAMEGIWKLMTIWLENSYMKKELKSCEKAKLFKTLGNKEFQAKNYAQSIQLYTTSALHAPAGSQELSVAIANRSASLFYLGRYDDCIRDIELAIKLDYPEELRYKLDLRAEQCYLKLGKQNLVDETPRRVHKIINNSNDVTICIKEDSVRRICEITSVKSCEQSNSENTSNAISLRSESDVRFGKNCIFPYASAGIEKKYTREKGRYVVANRFIKKGDILFLEKPVSFVLLSLGNSNNLCQQCCRSCRDIPVPCTTCLSTSYCDTKCFNEGWSSHNQWECVGSQMGLWNDIGIGHLALKVFFTCATTKDTIKFNEMQKLETNFDKFLLEDLVIYAITAGMLTMYLSKYTDFFKVNDLTECLVKKFSDETFSVDFDILTDNGKRLYVSSLVLRCILQLISNGHAITKFNTISRKDENASAEQDGIVATGIYPFASLMNHSCDPNILNIFMDQILIVRASRDIAKDEEVFNCYGPHYRQMAREHRQHILKSQYCFTCECEPCTLPKLQYFLERFNAMKCPECDGALCNIDDSLRCLDCSAKHTTYDQSKIKQAEVIFQEAKTCIDFGETVKGLEKLKECLSIRRAVLYKYNEDITATLDLIGETYATMGQWLDSISYLEDKIPAVSERYGSSSKELLCDLNKLMDVCIRYLQEEPETATDLYKSVLEKTQKYIDRVEGLIIFNYGSWNEEYENVKKKKEEHCMRLMRHLHI